MTKNTRFQQKKEQKISAIQPTDWGRAGLTLFAAYLQRIDLLPVLERMFGSMRKNSKGIAASKLLFQVLCFLMDGTSRHISWFDQLKRDQSHASVLDCHDHELASSHALKRFFGRFSFVRIYLFQHLLQKLLIWRLKKHRPAVVEPGLDSMVMDNDDAARRQGVEPTYKKVNGFHPLQMNWGRYFVDAVFRGGSHHSNARRSVEMMLRYIVDRIRREYDADVPILARMDAGFYDEKLFETCEWLKIGYICGGKRYRNVTDAASAATDWHRLSVDGKREIWEYTELMICQGTRKQARRSVYSRLIEHDGQLMLRGTGQESVVITNLGIGEPIDDQLRDAGEGRRLEAGNILRAYHDRGNDELANRALKDFGTEQLPFKRFAANAAWYYLMVLGNSLFEAFKEDIAEPVVPVRVYANTFRRQFLDIAGKIVRHGGRMMMKVSKATYERLQLDRLWARCQSMVPQLC